MAVDNLKLRVLTRTPWTNSLLLVCALALSVTLLTPRPHSLDDSFTEVVKKDQIQTCPKSRPLSRPGTAATSTSLASYCVYFHSLCLDKDAQLFLVTGDTSKHGQPVQLLTSSVRGLACPESRQAVRFGSGALRCSFPQFFQNCKVFKTPGYQRSKNDERMEPGCGFRRR